MPHSTQDDSASIHSLLPRGLIDPADRERCARSLSLLRESLSGGSLIFFVGAGASSAEPTGFPTGVQMLQILFWQFLARLRDQETNPPNAAPGKQPVSELPLGASDVLHSIATRVGFEITLSDLAQTWPAALPEILQKWADIAKRLPFNGAHLGLAAWLRAGGTVITTNYDCFIEEALLALDGRYPEVRYWTREESPPGDAGPTFDGWDEDLDRGGVLFKLHGSFKHLETCLATMDQVRTSLTGPRADLVSYVITSRPICFVGWRGADPDIPPIILSARRKTITKPVIWILHEGSNPEQPFRLTDRLDRLSADLSLLASENPLVSEATRVFQGLRDILRVEIQIDTPTPKGTKAALARAMTRVAVAIPATAVARFLAIPSRRTAEFELARTLLYRAEEVAVDQTQRAAAIQERAHLFWQTGERERALKEVARASAKVGRTGDLGLRLTTDFGELSMTILNLKAAPWIAYRVPGLLRRYRKDIEESEKAHIEPGQLALHKALYHLYVGRLLYAFASYLGTLARGPVASHILLQFDQAKHHIDRTEDIHLHSEVDVLSSRALALARFGHCEEAWDDFTEAERLASSLGDEARNQHLRDQRLRLEALCGPWNNGCAKETKC